MSSSSVLAAVAALALAGTPALAQEEPPPPPPAEGEPEFEPAGPPAEGLDLRVEADLLSDYRFRGVSRSDEDPAARAALILAHGSGFYGGVRATTLDGFDSMRARDPGFGDLGDAQLDLFAGYGAPIGGGWEVDAGLMYYVFAGGRGATDYAEPYASLSYLIGPVYATGGAKYAPAQDAIGDEDMLYLFGQLDVSVPFTPVRFTAHAGRQDWGRYGGYWNWSVGGRYAIGRGEIGLTYVDTNSAAPGADAGLVLSAGLRF